MLEIFVLAYLLQLMANLFVSFQPLYHAASREYSGNDLWICRPPMGRRYVIRLPKGEFDVFLSVPVIRQSIKGTQDI